MDRMSHKSILNFSPIHFWSLTLMTVAMKC